MGWRNDSFGGSPPWARVLNRKLDSIIAILANQGGGQDPAKLQAILDDLNAQTTKLGDAVGTNQP